MTLYRVTLGLRASRNAHDEGLVLVVTLRASNRRQLRRRIRDYLGSDWCVMVEEVIAKMELSNGQNPSTNPEA